MRQLFTQTATRFLSQNRFRIPFAAGLAFAVVIGFTTLKIVRNDELRSACQQEKVAVRCLLIESAEESFDFDNIEGFSILMIAILFILEGSDRKRQSHYEAWQILDNAFSANVETSYARVEALQDLNQDGVSLKGIDAPGADLGGVNLYKADLQEADFRGTILRSADLREARLTGANFSPYKIQNNDGVEIEKTADLTDANLTDADLSGANLVGANLTGAALEYARFSDAQFDRETKISLKWLIVWEVTNPHKSFQDRQSDFKKQDFSNSYLVGVNLSRTRLVSANFANANLASADLNRANLTGANLQKADLRRANLTRANLTGAKGSANFANANLAFADLRRANLTGANLQKADLRWANLTRANLKRANLDGANLTGARFEGADLTGARIDRRIARENYYLMNEKALARTRILPDRQSQDWRSTNFEPPPTLKDNQGIQKLSNILAGWFGEKKNDEQSSPLKRLRKQQSQLHKQSKGHR